MPSPAKTDNKTAATITARRRLPSLVKRDSFGLAAIENGMTAALLVACRPARRYASRSATSRAEAMRSAGHLACSRVSRSPSHSGSSGLISRMGRANSSQTCLSTSDWWEAEGRLAGTHRIEHAAQAEQVRCAADRLTHGLFGRHKHRCARHEFRLRLAQVVKGLRQPEIGELAPLPARRQQDIGGLDVTVDQSMLVSRREALGNLPPNAQRLLERERPRTIELLLQRAATQILHDNVGDGPRHPGRREWQ